MVCKGSATELRGIEPGQGGALFSRDELLFLAGVCVRAPLTMVVVLCRTGLNKNSPDQETVGLELGTMVVPCVTMIPGF